MFFTLTVVFSEPNLDSYYCWGCYTIKEVYYNASYSLFICFSIDHWLLLKFSVITVQHCTNLTCVPLVLWNKFKCLIEHHNWVVLSVAGTDRSAISLATRAGPVPAHSPSQMVVLWYVGPVGPKFRNSLSFLFYVFFTSHCCTLVTLMLSLYVCCLHHSTADVFLYIFV